MITTLLILMISGADLDARTNRVASLLRCPVCQGMSVADSPSEMAVNMKREVRDLLQRGYTEEQVLDHFERSYGQFVRLKPKFEGVNALVWLLPIFAVILGALIVMNKMKRLKTPASDDPYLTRVRDLVAGSKS